MTKLDRLDFGIIHQLDVNARQSNIQIAKKLKVSKDVVNYRISKLLDEKIIIGFYTEVDAYKMGYFSYRILIKLQNTTPERENEIIENLKNNPDVAWVHSAEGNWDLLIGVWAKNLSDFYNFQRELFDIYRKNTGEKMISIYHRMYIYKRDYLLTKTRKIQEEIFMGDERIEKTDETDMKIIQLLLSNGRIPIFEISNKLNLTPTTVTSRIKKLIKNKVILSFRPMLNLEALGFSWFKIHINLKEVSKEKRQAFFTYVKSKSETIYIDEMIAGYDFEIDAELKDHIHLRKYLEELKEGFADIIKDIQTLDLYKQHKVLKWLPE